ncbi:hypothetical protein TNIN_384621 [Trichonephila inaurata madagascariensis]|uniref:Endonuclease/exonuclease/phosphatase domain-containing protein n=1 Tax=Trichonephila inaurata madagascariensis TaxID=2747483 RepID=A0A8X6XA78_9ARAC|nr:hypothetical protein TNIN_384621 [Trichonephila inaurata madagascariensis]
MRCRRSRGRNDVNESSVMPPCDLWGRDELKCTRANSDDGKTNSCMNSHVEMRKKDKTIFWVATTHLKARQGPLLATMRREQGRDLLDFIKAHSGNNPVIVTGDFNANPSEPMYHALTKEDIFPLDSAYRYLNNKKTEPPYTTWKTGEYCHSRFFF